MQWEKYKSNFLIAAEEKGVSHKKIEYYLQYAQNLNENNLPIIYDQNHLSLLIGIDSEYIHRMSNSPQNFYRTFYIKKRNGKRRRIDEPLSDLKRVQEWILNNILYKMPVSKFAKAYVPSTSIKDNTRFHKKQEIVMMVDIKDFFPSIKSGYILNIFLSAGYNMAISVILTRLCCFRESLPQGAPTSAYLSNLVMRDFDNNISEYCLNRKIRYTRYADDLAFSGFFDIASVLYVIDQELGRICLKRNKNKLKIMKKGSRQKVTGIIVNEKQQLPREYRMKIRQEVYYIQKYGLDEHLLYIGETRANYLSHLIGKIKYSLYINPNDEKMIQYLDIVNSYSNRLS